MFAALSYFTIMFAFVISETSRLDTLNVLYCIRHLVATVSVKHKHQLIASTLHSRLTLEFIGITYPTLCLGFELRPVIRKPMLPLCHPTVVQNYRNCQIKFIRMIPLMRISDARQLRGVVDQTSS